MISHPVKVIVRIILNIIKMKSVKLLPEDLPPLIIHLPPRLLLHLRIPPLPHLLISLSHPLPPLLIHFHHLIHHHNHRRSEQSGFTAGRSTTERIFAIRQIIDKSKEFNKSAYIAFIDFKAAFHSISVP